MLKPLSPDELARMREACKVAAMVLDRTAKAVEVGMTTYDIDMVAKRAMEDLHCESTAHGCFNGECAFPGWICISVNDVVIHGIGDMKTTIKPGDIVSLDVVTKYKGMVGDNTRTVLIEPVPEPVRQLSKITEEALYAGIAAARVGNRVGDISYAIESYIKPYGYGIVREYNGHGVGRTMHEEPPIPNYGKPHKGEKLKAGLTLAIEPMICLGSHRIKHAADTWTVKTADGKPAAHWEHTVLVTDGDPEILTKL
ncbi:MAG: type I methionyl aminopeptidase [Opitutales bacterium]|nr:type I methionyl aminopeptidase [Opitutales bacterium]